MQEELDLSNEPEEYAVTITALVKSDSYLELRKRVKGLQEFVDKALRTDPNREGFYIAVDDVVTNIKPPVGKISAETEQV